jgi:hypothetical protein
MVASLTIEAPQPKSSLGLGRIRGVRRTRSRSNLGVPTEGAGLFELEERVRRVIVVVVSTNITAQFLTNRTWADFGRRNASLRSDAGIPTGEVGLSIDIDNRINV